ncbi:MAG: N-6 DNA methylase [Thiocapsa sp.]|uniref:methylation-associated defense system DNA methyltransferase MAD2 n=1 Tax=Thiocapsa sp. TaxID=2024551 RepID=UPI001BCF3044|nr:N-6 DNA methylase [Thiocapsa sp.]QVL48675.1 MAG: N-6 DNA methylase [Thiocapsa sp.]
MSDLEVEEIDLADDEVTSLEEGQLLDYITDKPVKDTPKEQVRQRIARALFHEYGISVEDMVPDFQMKIDGRNKKIDIAIFEPGADKTPENLRRVVICDKEPKTGSRGAYKMRDHKQAEKEFGLLYAAMSQEETEECRWGLWTNGIDFFFFEKERARFDTKFHPRGDWPMADGTLGSRTVASLAQLRRADRDMLLTAFRRCHNYIHGNEGMPKDAAFWQFLYLIFAKLHDERRPRDQPPRFWAGMFEKQVNGKRQLVDEQFDPEGQAAIRERVTRLVDEVAEKYKYTLFKDNPPRITLSDRALGFIVGELAKYDLGRTALDAKGAAYQELVKHNIRGDRGQYFTPRGPVDLMVAMLDPQPDERVMDPACGTGGFLVSTLKHLDAKLRAASNIAMDDESTDEFLSVQEELRAFVEHNLFGADFDPFLVRAAQMNVLMASNGQARVFNMNSLEFPAGHLQGVKEATGKADLVTMDVVMTNPPFGSNIPITDPNILKHFELAHIWERTEDGGFRNTGRLQGSVAPEVLFIERCIDWLRPGGRTGIVLPDGILGNPGDEYIRWWLLRHCWMLASIDLPVEVFIVEANVNILTSLLFLKKKTDEEVRAEDLGQSIDYPVFMAVAEKVGFDRRGNTLYKRGPDGEELVEEVEHRERVRVGGQSVIRVLRRKEKTLDNDLPYQKQDGTFVPGPILEAYRAFRANHAEPGA